MRCRRDGRKGRRRHSLAPIGLRRKGGEGWLPSCAPAAKIFGEKALASTGAGGLDRRHGRAGPLSSARFCASHEKYEVKDFNPFGFHSVSKRSGAGATCCSSACGRAERFRAVDLGNLSETAGAACSGLNGTACIDGDEAENSKAARSCDQRFEPLHLVAPGGPADRLKSSRRRNGRRQPIAAAGATGGKPPTRRAS